MLSTRKTPSYYDMLDCRRSGFTSSKCTLVVPELLDALVVDVVIVCKNEKMIDAQNYRWQQNTL